MLTLATPLVLAATGLFAATLIPTDELLGGQPCPGACPNTCPIAPQDPTYGGSSCVEIQATCSRVINIPCSTR